MIPLLIARNTFREATRDRVLAGILLAGLAMLGVTQVVGVLSLGEERRLTVDIGLSGMALLGLFVVLLVGTSLVAKEIERRTIYNLLSRPIARYEYLIGKWAGLCGALWIVCIILGCALWGVLRLRGFAGHGLPLCQAVYMTGLELSVVTAIAVLFSALSTPVLSSLYTLGFFLIGQWSYDLRGLAERAPASLAALLNAVANIVPNLPLFNVRSLVASATGTSLDHLLMATVYALFYCACALALATAAFESRDFK
jgi:ABC-type transport system involved in multi-copper enzyme maturation permease subunit